VKIAPRPLPSYGRNRHTLVLETKFFRMERLDLAERIALDPIARGFEVIFIAEGSLEIRSPDFSEIARAGTTHLLPRGLDGTGLTPTPSAVVLRITT
jgi:hypothetical protein